MSQINVPECPTPAQPRPRDESAPNNAPERPTTTPERAPNRRSVCGGGFTANSPVSLLVPPFIAADTYANTLNIRAVANLPTPELLENRRRSVAMLPPGAPALNRDDALEVLEQLAEALRQLRDLRRRVD